MISVQQALAHIWSNRPTPPAETVPISNAINRILANDVSALMDMPAFSTANMDGYAVTNCAAGDQLSIIGESSAGHPFKGSVAHGDAVRISTGALIPTGADRILIQEQVRRSENNIVVNISPNIGTHIRPPASDFSAGMPLLKSGIRLNSADLTLLAAAGHATAMVNRKLKVAIVSSGDEVRPIGTILSVGDIYAANSVGLVPLFESWGADVTDLGILADTPEAVANLRPRLRNYDIIVPIGGASVGRHDYMRSGFRDQGFELIFETVALRPGKPSWMGRQANQIVFGLPGNPASVFVCAHLFLKPLLGRQTQYLKAVLYGKLDENGPRETYLRASAFVKDGQIHVQPETEQDSFRLRPQSNANALVKVPPLGGPYDADDLMEIILVDELARAE